MRGNRQHIIVGGRVGGVICKGINFVNWAKGELAQW